jgi:hypothetical protein
MQADIDQAFGGGLNPALETPQGQLASSFAAIKGNANDTFVNMANQFDPAFAAGRFQDALGRIYFIERNPALPTVVQATCSGLAEVPIARWLGLKTGTFTPAPRRARSRSRAALFCRLSAVLPVRSHARPAP